jgi:phytol kinase
MFALPSWVEAAAAFMLFLWVLFVSHVLTRWTYRKMVSRDMPHHVAVYYNRKIIHILAGGVVAMLVPFIFKTFTPILALVSVLAVGNYLPHRLKRLNYWYQVEENMYEVHFVIMWGLVMGLGFLLDNVMMAVLPILFMSVGDGVTGIVRNALFRRRTKSWWGNLAMAAFCIPAGFMLQGVFGGLAGALASVVEKFEFGPIDDNITVPLSSFLVLLTASMTGSPVVV